MIKKGIVDTSEPRNVLAHIVSGAIASAVISGAVNYKKVKDDKKTKNEAIKDTVKRTTQGAVATGTAIATTNYLGQKSGILKAVTAFSVGMAGIYAIEVLDKKLNNNDKLIENKEEGELVENAE